MLVFHHFQSTRDAFGKALVEHGEHDPHIVVLDADLAKSTKTEAFGKAFPERFFDMGIAEANMIGTAAGLALQGFKSFACSFACFLTGRFDTIRMSVAYSQAKVRLVGTHAGLGVGADGYSQMGLEDVALMRSLPGMQIFSPADATSTQHIMRYLCSHEVMHPSYLRLMRQELPILQGVQQPFELMKVWNLVASQNSTKPHIGLISTGAGTYQALLASRLLHQQGIAHTVLDVHCLKPFDLEGFSRWLKMHPWRALGVIEDHTVMGGLGSIIAEHLLDHALYTIASCPVLRFGVLDVFGSSGSVQELYVHHGLDPEFIVKKLLDSCIVD